MRCPSCGADAAPDARYCVACGTALIRPASALDRTDVGQLARSPAPAGDRRVVTALFADLVDYVRMLAEHDPEVVRARVDAALATMGSAIERFEGTREKFIGDAIFAVFGWPRAHDDDAVRGALAALTIRSGLQDVGGGEPLDVRIGIATGEVVAADGSTDGDLRLTGNAITTAARIQSMARPGEILLDEATRQAARDRLATDPRGSVVLRGQSTAVEIHALRAEAGTGAWTPFRAGPASPMVGRSVELGTIETVLDRVASSGRGAIVVVEGDAGMGKSRLLAAVESAARERDFAWTWTENVSYGRVEPYRWARLFAQMIADEHGIDSGALTRRFVFTDDLDPAARRRLGGAIAAMARDAEFSGWEAEAADTPADPADVTAALGEVATRYVDRLLATTGRRVVVIDDLHWLDPSSVGLVELVAGRTDGHPLVVLAAARPGSLPGWATADDVVRIHLDGLDEPETARLATIVARAAVDADGARRIHERTGGNPLFVGETVRAFLHDGTLQWRDGRVALTRTGGSALPITLRAVLGARIDALPAGAREVLGVASVIGIEFRPSLVEELLDEPVERGAFDSLVASSLVVPQEDDQWRFAHALIQDAAYAGMLASRRRALHTALADQLERSGLAAPGQVATHRAAAGDTARAIPLLRDAAERALALGAVTEAAGFLRHAANLADPDDPAGAAADRARADELQASAAVEDAGVAVASAAAFGPR